MLASAENKQKQYEGKIKSDIKKQQDRLEERIKERRMRSEAGSVKKSKIKDEEDKEFNSPYNQHKDSRFEYFESPVISTRQNGRNRPLTSSV